MAAVVQISQYKLIRVWLKQESELMSFIRTYNRVGLQVAYEIDAASNVTNIIVIIICFALTRS